MHVGRYHDHLHHHRDFTVNTIVTMVSEPVHHVSGTSNIPPLSPALCFLAYQEGIAHFPALTLLKGMDSHPRQVVEDHVRLINHTAIKFNCIGK